ncbi:IS481 family transposase [Mycolicibacterium thermoresistibile]|uniref:Integrase family protein n=2 Tax=Mycolicibacterium thermoresistibile TaxID=1797 RepID=G7CBE6_MYCT3|nr:IS481 family transposase [Mycolicibacterium thermoresistibile]EHI14671.1 integrase family protein [Mycolicibacterium thermoresistibile ATCC 19527]MCV7189206.1 IS481 family transposase [Mycolicibacterium thermoresistibile]GAT15029.1 integrase family protein [Mycolicibacterium thermoresistibile]SNW19492.1 integrase family protein [Mycolicibacterium thermoresistibile]
MAQKVTAMDIRMAAAVAGEIDNVAEFCRRRKISRQTFYKFRRRFRDSGIEGLQELSRRPLTSPGQTPVEVEDLIVLRRKQLIEQGRDHGAQSIVWSFERDGVTVPSVSTVWQRGWQILSRRGAITPQPQKRPKSATKRFVFSCPNECWQSDWTGWVLADGSPAGIAGSLDDHSRYVPALRACAGDADAQLVWETMLAGIAECGIPSMSLTDNGIVYTGRFHAHQSAFETNLRALGVQTINATPFHPQTCGKIERFWQTLKKWLTARDPATTIAELNALLEQFRTFYNHQRPHRAHRGALPAEVFAAGDKARPADRPVPAPVIVSRHTVGPTSGYVFVAPYKVNVGLRWAGHECDIIRDGQHITILSGTTLVRSFTADPTRNYQRGDKTTRTYRTREPKPPS